MKDGANECLCLEGAPLGLVCIKLKPRVGAPMKTSRNDCLGLKSAPLTA